MSTKKTIIERLDLNTPNIDNYIDIQDTEIVELYYMILKSYQTNNLSTYGVKPLCSKMEFKIESDDLSIKNSAENSSEIIKTLGAKELQLIFLFKYIGKFVHKDLISEFVRKKIPSLNFDQQIRHLGTQYGWYVLNKGAKIPDKNITVPSGYHYLFSIETPNPKFLANALKRIGRQGAKNFIDLKIVYENKCATCGIKEGTKDTRTNKQVILQQGHMDPRKSLTIDNTIPQCEYCNQTYKDYFRFNEYGRVISVNNPEILLESPVDIQNEMIRILVKVKNNREN